MWNVCHFLLIINFLIIGTLIAYHYPDEESVVLLLLWHLLVILDSVLRLTHTLPLEVVKYNETIQRYSNSNYTIGE